MCRSDQSLTNDESTCRGSRQTCGKRVVTSFAHGVAEQDKHPLGDTPDSMTRSASSASAAPKLRVRTSHDCFRPDASRPHPVSANRVVPTCPDVVPDTVTTWEPLAPAVPAPGIIPVQENVPSTWLLPVQTVTLLGAVRPVA